MNDQCNLYASLPHVYIYAVMTVRINTNTNHLYICVCLAYCMKFLSVMYNRDYMYIGMATTQGLKNIY